MAAADENRGKVDSNIADNNPGKSQETAEIDRKDTPRKTNDSLTMSNASASQPPADMEFILDIPLEITAELGRTEIRINELLKLGQGSVIEFSKLAGETLDVLANQKLIAKGEVVVVNDKYGIRLTEIAPPTERIERLR